MKVIRVTLKSGQVHQVGKAQLDKLYFTWDELEVRMDHHLAILTSKSGGEQRFKVDSVQSVELVEIEK